jgi:competence protein ComFC
MNADWLLELVYPAKCALCGTLGPEPVCGICFSQFDPHPVRAGRSHDGLDFAASLFDYTGAAARAVQRLKYGRVTSLVDWMAGLLRQGAEDRGLLDVDSVVPVPIHWTRLCFRGFNQAELLCEQMPPDLVRKDLLMRGKATRAQVGLTDAERDINLDGAFQASPACKGAFVLLVDDVLTSGGTARECARALKGAGAQEVGILTFAGERKWRQ